MLTRCPLLPPCTQVTTYALESVQQRGRLFVKPGEGVYEGQVIGIYQRQGDLKVGRRAEEWAQLDWAWLLAAILPDSWQS